MCRQVFVQGGEFSFKEPLTCYRMYPKLLSCLYVSRSKQQSTHQCHILAVHDVTESVLVQGDCRSSARHRIKNRCYAATIVAAIEFARARPA